MARYTDEDLRRLAKISKRFSGQVSSLHIEDSNGDGESVTEDDGLPAKCYLTLRHDEALALASHLLQLVEANERPRDILTVNLPHGTYVTATLTTKRVRALQSQCAEHLEHMASR